MTCTFIDGDEFKGEFMNDEKQVLVHTLSQTGEDMKVIIKIHSLY